MGDAFTAVATDESSLFYNPAGLARVRGINWKVFDVEAGASGTQAYESIEKLKTSNAGSGFAGEVNSLFGDHVWTGVGGESMFTMPMFGFGVYDHAGGSIQIDNPVYPMLRSDIINDFGYVMGVGLPVSPFLHVGFDVKYIKRTGTETTFGPGSLADLQPGNITGQLTPWGVGYGADLGMTAFLPAPLFTAAFSAAWKDIGETQFKTTGTTPIPDNPNNITLGTALTFDLPLLTITPALDFMYLNDTTMQMTQKINFGVEVALPILSFRGGFHEGYYTAGVGVNMGLFRVDAATYGEELGAYPGQIEDRRYLVQFTMQLGIGNFSAASDPNGKSSTSSNSSGSSSIWGSGPSLKQRR